MLNRLATLGATPSGRARIALLLLTLLAPWAASIDARNAATTERGNRFALQATGGYGRLPLVFEPNVGQTHGEVKFLSRAPGYVLFLTAHSAVVASDGIAPLRLEWLGTQEPAVIAGGQPLPGRSHYYRSSDPQRWQTDVPQFGSVRYSGVYRGVDLVYYATKEGRIEYDLIVSPGADPAGIAFALRGASATEIDDEGNLRVRLAGPGDASMALHKPVIYQDVNGRREMIPGGYDMTRAGRIGFRVGAYDRERPLVIDPVLTLQYSTFLGGSGSDKALAIAVDDAGSAVITGNTTSIDFPTSNAVQATAPGGDDHFVAKLSPNGSSLVYSTYLGGSGGEGANQGAIALDAAGNAYVAGSTFSEDFPTTVGAHQTDLNVAGDAFNSFDGYVVKLTSSGALAYSTLLGGGSFDAIYTIDVDSAGNAYVAGATLSNNFPLVTPIKATQDDAFVAKLNAAGSALVYSTYFGGNHNDVPHGIAVDASGSAYVTGLTRSSNFPAVNAVQAALDGATCAGIPCGDAFLTKINAAGSAFVYSTFLGGSDRDRGADVEVDSSGAAYVIGDTLSSNFPTASPLQAMNAGAEDAFVAKVNPSGSSLVYSTYLGGSGREGTSFANDHIVGFGIAVDAAGDAYVAGVTASSNFPSVDAFQAFVAGGSGEMQAFAAKLNAAGSALTYSTALNPPQPMSDQADVAVDLVGGAYLAGGVSAIGTFPTTPGAIQTVHGGGPLDAFVAKLTHFNTVTIDIKPNSSPNTINLGSNGVVAVAILSSATFDATTVDPVSVTLASAPVKLKGNGTPQALFQDVDGDGRQDLVVHVLTDALQLSATDTEAVLEAETFGGAAVVGTDLVRVVP